MGNSIDFKPDDPARLVPPAPPIVRIVEPATSTVLKPHGELRCRAKIIVPGGGHVPVTASIYLTKVANGGSSSVDATPSERDADGSYVVRGTFGQPKQPGRYRLHARAWITYRIGDNPDDPNAQFMTYPYDSPPVSIEVR